MNRDAAWDRWEALIDREAVGEELSATERAFVEDFERAHPECAEERRLWAASLEALGGELERASTADERAREIAAAALAADTQEIGVTATSAAATPKTTSARRRWPLALGLAAAAALALWWASDDDPAEHAEVEHPRHDPPNRERAEPPARTPEPGGAPVELAAEVLRFSDPDAATSSDSSAGPGERLSARDGRACLVWTKPRAVVCIEGGSLRISGPEDLHRGERHLWLESGTLVAALDPLGPGQRFTVDTVLGKVSAVGTVFVVELRDGRADAFVREGQVVVDDGEQRPLAAGEATRLRPEVPVADDEDEHHAALRGRVEALATLAEALRAGEDDPEALAELAAAAPPEPAGADGTGPERPRVLPAGELAAAAQRARMARDYDETARLYRALLSHHPDSPEAANVPVRLGDLLMTTGDHAGALEAYEQYLERGPQALALEAELGRIQALRALGREGAEREAIEAFLQAHPDHHRSAALSERLSKL